MHNELLDFFKIVDMPLSTAHLTPMWANRAEYSVGHIFMGLKTRIETHTVVI